MYDETSIEGVKLEGDIVAYRKQEAQNPHVKQRSNKRREIKAQLRLLLGHFFHKQ
jgi:hypothetical protein